MRNDNDLLNEVLIFFPSYRDFADDWADCYSSLLQENFVWHFN